MVMAALGCIVPAMAQQQFGSAKYKHMCSYYGEEITGDITAYSAGPTAEKVIKNIMSVIGLKANFELREANVPNAAAVMLKGKRFILYNPKFMDNINSSTGTYWAAISILAHEIGHHLNGHTLDNVGSRPQTELDADEFSGFILHKMGASLTDAQAVMALISSPQGSKSHPPKRDRLAYIANGWTNAGREVAAASVQVSKAAGHTALVAEKGEVMAAVPAKPVKATPVPARAESTPAVPESKAKRAIEANAGSDVYFSEDPDGKYYLTRKGKLVQLENDKLYLVSSIYKSDRSGYTAMFSDQEGTKIYVGANGDLVNPQGRKIGYMKAR